MVQCLEEGEGERVMELKPCPFCGSDRVNVTENKFQHLFNSFGVKCFNCKTESYQFFDSRKEAIEAWNRRASYDRGYSQ